MVLIQHCFLLEQHCFHIELGFESISLKCLNNMKNVYQDNNNVVLDGHFSCYSNISNLLIRIPTQSSLVIQNSCSSCLSCTLSLLLSLPSDWHEQLLTALDTFSRNQHHMPLHKGHQILGTLHSVFLSVPGSDVNFSCLKKTL